MSILIKGIDLPEAYTSACLTVFECVDGHAFVKTYKVSPEQMQTIPPHGPLKDADALLKEIPETSADVFENCRYCRLLDDEQVKMLINDAPTIIEAEEGEKGVCE